MQQKTQKDYIKADRISKIYDYLMELYTKTYDKYVRLDNKHIATSHGINDSYVTKAVYSLGYMKKGVYHTSHWNTDMIPDMKMAEQVEVEAKKFVNNLKLTKTANNRITAKKSLRPIYGMDAKERAYQMRLNMSNETYILQCLQEMYKNREFRFKLSERAHKYNIDVTNFFAPLIDLDIVTKHLIVDNQYVWSGDKPDRTLASIIKEAYQQAGQIPHPTETDMKTNTTVPTTIEKKRKYHARSRNQTHEELEDKILYFLDAIYMNGINKCDISPSYILRYAVNMSSEYLTKAIQNGYIRRYLAHEGKYYSLTDTPENLLIKVISLVSKTYRQHIKNNNITTFSRTRPPFVPSISLELLPMFHAQQVRKDVVEEIVTTPEIVSPVKAEIVTTPEIVSPVKAEIVTLPATISESHLKLTNTRQKALDHRDALIREQSNLAKELEEINALLAALDVIENSKYK